MNIAKACMLAIAVCWFALIGASQCARAHEGKMEWAQYTAEEQKWLESQKMTPEARTRMGHSWESCCEHADRVKAELRHVVRSDAPSGEKYADEWWYFDVKTDKWVLIPDDIIHREFDPTMPPQLRVEGALFIYGITGQMLCFWAPEDGG